jgi:hypothetical protein
VTAWRDIARELRRYDSAVITARGRDGYPVSVRCVPVPDERTATFELSIPDALGVEASPAWLLCHFHDERFWSLRSFGARGFLEHKDDGWRFRPMSFVGGMGGVVASIRLFMGGRRRARRYLAARGLEAPEIPWERMTAIKREVKAQRAAGSAMRRAQAR